MLAGKDDAGSRVEGSPDGREQTALGRGNCIG